MESTAIPTSFQPSAEAAEWWATLGPQERIIAALMTEPEDDALYVAQKPWKWAQEAYDLAVDNAR